MPIKKTIRAELFITKSHEWSYRIIAGNGRITLTPGESYKLRGGARRALRSLGDEARAQGAASPLSSAVFDELDREQDAWNARKNPAGKEH